MRIKLLGKLSGNDVNNELVTSDSDLYTDLKNCIMELEKQLLKKNVTINYLTMQAIPKYWDKTILSCSHKSNHKNKINEDKDNNTQLEKEDSSNKVVIIGDSSNIWGYLGRFGSKFPNF